VKGNPCTLSSKPDFEANDILAMAIGLRLITNNIVQIKRAFVSIETNAFNLNN
jgi:hypothetical protein